MATTAALLRKQTGVRRIVTTLELTDLQGNRTGETQISSVMIGEAMVLEDGMVVVEVEAVAGLEGMTLVAEAGIATAEITGSKEEDMNQNNGMKAVATAVAAKTEDKAATSMVT